MHIEKLLRASDKSIFSFDGDQAGRRAAWRALQQCLPLLRDDVSVRFLFFPAEHDPDSYIREFGQEAFRATVAEAAPLSRFLIDRSEENTSELQSLMRNSYAVFWLKQNINSHNDSCA